ncbi:MAG: response regulator [Lysobacter sp.]|nr:response regulator [Lysobacter sp.]
MDDNCDAADTLALMVEMLGHDVRRLYDPHEVVAEVERFGPELLFLDVGMPGLNGYDLARALRQIDSGKDIAIVAVTGWGQPEDRRMTRAAGFDEHLVKPPAFDAIQRLCNSPFSRHVDDEQTQT